LSALEGYEGAMPTQIIHAPLVLAIPVGNRVEVRTFAVEEGVFSKRWVAREHDPLIIDLGSGVVHGAAWLFQEITMYQSGTVRPDLPLEVRGDLREHSRQTGKVLACRVAWIGSGDSRYPQTSLRLELD